MEICNCFQSLSLSQKTFFFLLFCHMEIKGQKKWMESFHPSIHPSLPLSQTRSLVAFILFLTRSVDGCPLHSTSSSSPSVLCCCCFCCLLLCSMFPFSFIPKGSLDWCNSPWEKLRFQLEGNLEGEKKRMKNREINNTKRECCSCTTVDRTSRPTLPLAVLCCTFAVRI